MRILALSMVVFGMLVYGQTTVTTPLPCTSPVQRVMVFPTGDGGAQNCPTTQSPNRRVIRFCNSKLNLGSPTFTVRIDSDGGWPTTAINSPGTKLGVGDCDTYVIQPGVVPRCICDVIDSGIEITECR